MKPLALCCLLSACGVRLDGPPGVGPDAAPGGDGSVEIDAPAACPNGRVVYLNFEGQPLTRGVPSNATLNQASWMNITSGAAPPYKSGAADRDQQIQAVVAGVRAQLASFPISVVTQRPAAGPYVMIIFGGTASQVGSRYGGAVNTLDCPDDAKSDVAWVSDIVSPTQVVVNFAVGAIGFGIGLTATLDPRGCMCGWDNDCDQDATQPCRWSQMITRDPAANQLCPGTTQNEVAALQTEFCR